MTVEPKKYSKKLMHIQKFQRVQKKGGPKHPPF